MKMRGKLNYLTFTIAMFIITMVIINISERPSERLKSSAADTVSSIEPNKVESSQTNEDQESEQRKRLQRIEKVCRNITQGKTENILMYKPKQMSYCVIPKNGCTFWIRIMRFLNKDTQKTVSSPFEITRGEAHGWKYTQTLYRLQNQAHRVLIFNSTRFQVGRDPYSKLLSGYMDKLFLSVYWTFQGSKMIKRVRKNPSNLSLKCGHDLTFVEYLTFLLSEKENPTRIDGHFRPVQFYCSPCIFKPHFVAKQETFQKDTEYILGKFGLQNLVKSYDHKSHVTDELTILLNEYSGWANSNQVRSCLGRKEYLLRVWKTFQINGYLPLGSESVLTDNNGQETFNKTVFKEAVFQAFNQGKIDKTKTKLQRRQMLIEMYRQVPRTILEEIAKMYKHDFELFGYDSHPSDIFS